MKKISWHPKNFIFEARFSFEPVILSKKFENCVVISQIILFRIFKHVQIRISLIWARAVQHLSILSVIDCPKFSRIIKFGIYFEDERLKLFNSGILKIKAENCYLRIFYKRWDTTFHLLMYYQNLGTSIRWPNDLVSGGEGSKFLWSSGQQPVNVDQKLNWILEVGLEATQAKLFQKFT